MTDPDRDNAAALEQRKENAALVVRTAASRLRLSVSSHSRSLNLQEALGARGDGTDVVDEDVEAVGLRDEVGGAVEGVERSTS